MPAEVSRRDPTLEILTHRVLPTILPSIPLAWPRYSPSGPRYMRARTVGSDWRESVGFDEFRKDLATGVGICDAAQHVLSGGLQILANRANQPRIDCSRKVHTLILLVTERPGDIRFSARAEQTQPKICRATAGVHFVVLKRWVNRRQPVPLAGWTRGTSGKRSRLIFAGSDS
jgi:hypothetical protein